MGFLTHPPFQSWCSGPFPWHDQGCGSRHLDFPFLAIAWGLVEISFPAQLVLSCDLLRSSYALPPFGLQPTRSHSAPFVRGAVFPPLGRWDLLPSIIAGSKFRVFLVWLGSALLKRCSWLWFRLDVEFQPLNFPVDKDSFLVVSSFSSTSLANDLITSAVFTSWGRINCLG